MFTTWGVGRGDCGHVHREKKGAQKCLEKDREGCRKKGGSSDREIRGIAGRSEMSTYDTRKGPGQRYAV